jgi:hypothetical protein
MELPRLAAKQKRYLDILHFAQNEVHDPGVKPNLLKVLGQYKAALAKAWAESSLSAESQTAINSIERELESLHNQARLRSNAP